MVSPEPLTVRSARIKAARRLTRRACRVSDERFLAEGPQAVREALGHGQALVEIYADTSADPDLRRAAEQAGVPVIEVTPEALASITETVSPQGVVALCQHLDTSLEVALASAPRLVVVCAHVRDPGNAGVVIRCADAAGADAVILAGESVDPYNGKAVRASVGSLFHLPVVTGVSVTEAVEAARSAGLWVVGADGGSGVTLDSTAVSERLTEPTAWMFGNESWGLPAADASLADDIVGIPIYGRAESLNLATAAAVCLYASARAQRGHPQPPA